MTSTLRPIVAALRTGNTSASTEADAQGRLVVPFITISRMAGAGGRSLARALEARLNSMPASQRRIPRDWQSFDRDLIERIAADHEISAYLLDSIEDRGRNWVLDLFREMSGHNSSVVEAAAYRKVAESIAALAGAGHTIMVGRGSAFITAHMPGGIHVLIIAPHAHRVTHMAHERNISESEADRLVRQIDQNRADFYRDHWPGKTYGPESFTLTLNSARLSDEQMADAVAALIR